MKDAANGAGCPLYVPFCDAHLITYIDLCNKVNSFISDHLWWHDKVVAYGKHQQNKPNTGLIN